MEGSMGISARFSSLRTVSLLAFAALSLSVCSGCAVGLAAAGAGGTIAYVKGNVEHTYPYPIDLVWDASMGAMAASEVPVTDSGKDQLTAKIEGRTATGDKIKIVMASQGSVTTLKIRVNTFGNKRMSNALLRQINLHLTGPEPYPGSPQLAPPQSIGRDQSYAPPNAPRTASWQPPGVIYR
jgi:uncharacterized protein DUF3568